MEWKLSAAWAGKPLRCTVNGIHEVCGGRCCYGPHFWPGKSGSRPDNSCDHLGPEGCTLTPADRPVTCLLYPLKLNKAHTLVAYHRAKSVTCAANWGSGPPMVAALYECLRELFGADEADRIVAEVSAGRDVTVQVPDDVVLAYELERLEEAANKVPLPRRAAVAQMTPVQRQRLMASHRVEEPDADAG